MKDARRNAARVFLALISLSVVATFLLARAEPAWAHATLISSSPGADERLAKSPTQVTIQFDEPVSTSAGGVTVLDASGTEVQQGSGRQPTSKTLRVKLKRRLADGTYLANYNGISSDGHIVKGSIVFVVGSGAIADVSALESHRDAFADDLNRAGQFLAYLAVLLAAGLAFFLGFVHDGGSERRLLGRVLAVAVAVGVVGMIATITGEAALLSTKGVDAVFDGTTLRSVLRTGLGWQSAIQLAGLVLCVLSVAIGQRLARQVLAFYGGLAAASSFVLFGHTRTGDKDWLTIPADVVHLCVAGAWLGGLVGLAVVLRRRSRESGALSSTVAVVRKFSTVAAVSVVLLAVAGVALGYGEVGAFSRLTSTSYGHLLLIKLAIVGVIFAMAIYNRFVLLRGFSERENETSGWRALLRTVRFEALGIVAVLVVTSLLANTAPAATLEKPAPPFAATQSFRGGKATLRITPNRLGTNDFDLVLVGPDGRALGSAVGAIVYLSLPAKSLGPITVGTAKASPGHFVAKRTSYLSIAGTWVIAVQLALADGQQAVTFRDGLR
jgi:copper transport protein